MYETNKSFVDEDKRSFTIGQKRHEVTKDGPGPGRYDADKSLDSIKYRSPRQKFNNSKARGDEMKPNSPKGPGDYHNEKPFA